MAVLDIAELIKSPLVLAANIVDRLFKTQRADSASLVEFTKTTRVEPILLLDERLYSLPYINDVLQSMSSLFIGYYLQAVSLTTRVGRIRVLRTLDSLNPDRDTNAHIEEVADALIETGYGKLVSMASLESYGRGLPLPGTVASMEVGAIISKQPTIDPPVELTDTQKLEQSYKDDADKQALNSKGKLVGKSIKTDVERFEKAFVPVNLAVGKLVDVTLKDGDQEASFPIMIRAITTVVPAGTLAHILGDGLRPTTAKERYHLWREGSLSFWRDIVFASDLIDQHRKALATEQTGIYQEILRRRSSSMRTAALTGSPSRATASNLIVISKETADEIERETNGRFKDAKFRDKLFQNTYVMILAIVDSRDFERVTFYHRGISMPTTLSVRDLKVANKGTGPDVAEILRAYQLSNSPVL